MQKPLEGEIVPPDESTPVDSAKAANDEAKVRKDFWATFKRHLNTFRFLKSLSPLTIVRLIKKHPFMRGRHFLAHSLILCCQLILCLILSLVLAFQMTLQFWLQRFCVCASTLQKIIATKQKRRWMIFDGLTIKPRANKHFAR